MMLKKLIETCLAESLKRYKFFHSSRDVGMGRTGGREEWLVGGEQELWKYYYKKICHGNSALLRIIQWI